MAKSDFGVMQNQRFLHATVQFSDIPGSALGVRMVQGRLIRSDELPICTCELSEIDEMNR